MSDKKRVSKETEARIRKRVDCERKAHETVERLIENPVSEEMFIEIAKYIHPDHYEDIIEERYISKLCGYPICKSFLKNIPKQKYKICTRTNTVVDITSRKRFCSDFCYEASLHYEKQIPNSSVWMREGEDVKIELLSADTNPMGKPGAKVTLRLGEDIKEELEQLEKIDSKLESLKLDEDSQKAHSLSYLEYSKNTVGDQDSDEDEQIDRKNEPTDIIAKRLRKVKILEVEFDSDDEQSCDDTDDKERAEIPAGGHDLNIQQMASYVGTEKSFEDKVKENFTDWFTDATAEFITGSGGKTKDDKNKEKWNSLRNEADIQNDKVSKFYHPKICNKVRFEEPENERTMTDVDLPDVDKYTQIRFRRRITMEKLTKAMTPLLEDFRLAFRDISDDVRQLVNTFNLTSDNIVMKSTEWRKIATYVLLCLKKTPDTPNTLDDKDTKFVSDLIGSTTIKSVIIGQNQC
ncbi:DgyrCDS11367 [Dimorphilus gyrociliatus]|uniref:RNA polymerase II subunit B1 CTD phosphatase RPAP2 homolog n=1 Tax=Dimorphilus gyrociliatus TaxID=2664684 RepID=A0A7I8W453_9ANNE|nr:DgyrCDS11367 [Dimorphilus gyrociliatus]